MRGAKPVLVFFALAALLITSCGGNSPSESPKVPTSPARLFVIERKALSDPELVLLEALQGLLARQEAEEAIWLSFPGGDRLWLEDLATNYGVTLDRSYKTDPWGVVRHFRDRVRGYILYDLGQDSENVATSLAGVYQALPVTPELERAALELGLKKLLDVRGKNEEWCFENYRKDFSREVVCHLDKNIHDALRDYAVARKALVFFGSGQVDFMERVFEVMERGGLVLGWGGPESEFVAQASRYDLLVVPTDHAHNLSVLSRFSPPTLRQKHHLSRLRAEEKVHYATFIMTDGDNVGWLLNDFAVDERWFGSRLRGSFPMGWTISPTLLELAPTAMKCLYDKATKRDFFICGPSGRGYFYPSCLPHLRDEAARLNRYLEKTDLGIICVLDVDYRGFRRGKLEPYASLPGVIGGFWVWYDDYAGRKGDIIFVSGKPFVSARFKLWGDVEGGDPASVAAAINALPADPHSIQGYSVVTVHPWTMSLNDVRRVMDLLDPDVRVVGPEEFIRLIKQNLSPDLFWTFAVGKEGWQDGAGKGKDDKAQWLRHEGNPPGCLFLDGSDFGRKDSEPNSWFRREVLLPVNARYLRFQTRGSADGNDGSLRVRLWDGSTWHVLLDWEVMGGKEWRTREADISRWAGRRVIFSFEQDDDGEGNGEMRYLDNVEIVAQGVVAGACYYGWYEEGTWNPHPYHPLLGRYSSRDVNVIGKHLEWARRADLEFLAYCWDQPGSRQDVTLRDYFLPVLEDSGLGIRFAIHSGFPGATGESMPVDFSEEVEPGLTRGERLIKDFEYIARAYFDHPLYLRVSGRPVVFIYLVRDWRNASPWLGELRTRMQALGIDPFLVADVVYWGDPESQDWAMLSEHFDGIMGYNLYESDREEMENYLESVKD